MSINKMDEQLTKLKVWITFLNNVVDKGYNNDHIMLNTLVDYLDSYNLTNTTSDNNSASDDEYNIYNDSNTDSENDSPFIFEHDTDINMHRLVNIDNIYPSYKLKDDKIEPSSPMENYKKLELPKLIPNVSKEQQKIDAFLNNSFEDKISSFTFYSTNGTKTIDRMNQFIKSNKFIK
jgi:hypothetical protein